MCALTRHGFSFECLRCSPQGSDIGEFQNHRSFLDPDNFSSLISFGPYRDDAVDVAADNLDSDDVFRCWECENDSLSLRPSETYYCYCCGLTAVSEAASYCNCTICGANRGVCYDPLSTTNEQHRGRCLHCHAFVWVWHCPDCGSTRTNKELTGPQRCQRCTE